MKKQVRVGQCYEKDDVIYEVINKGPLADMWLIRTVINKCQYYSDTETLSKMRRPFNTEG